MKDQYTIDDGESKQDKWNRGLDIFIESLTNQKQDNPEDFNRVPYILMFVGVILCTLLVIVAGYFHGNMHLITTLKNAANP